MLFIFVLVGGGGVGVGVGGVIWLRRRGGEKGSTEGRVGQIRDEAAEVAVRGVVLVEVVPDGARAFAADAAAVEVGAEDDGAEVGAGEGEGARAHEGVVGEFTWSGLGEVGGDEGEFGVHGGGGDVAAFLEVVEINGFPAAFADQAAEVEVVGMFGVELVVFEDGEVLVWVFHPYGAFEGHEVEAFD